MVQVCPWPQLESEKEIHTDNFTSTKIQWLIAPLKGWEEEMKSVFQVYVPGTTPGQRDKTSIGLIFAKEEVQTQRS